MFGLNPLQIVYAVIATVLVTAVGGYIWHCQRVSAQFTEFKILTKAAGEQAKAAAEKKEADDRQAKEKSDAENERTIATLRSTIAKLRHARPSSSFVPATPPSSSRPDLICFDRTEYIRTDGDFTDRARNLSDEGSEATVNLNTAKRWASSISLPPRPPE